MNQIGIILSKPRSLTSLIDLATETITDQNLYNLSLAKTTSDNREVDLLAQSHRFNENIIEKLKLTSFGKNTQSMPNNEELAYVLGRFGGKSFCIEYEIKTATGGQDIMIGDYEPLDANRQCLTVLEYMLRLQDRHDMLNIGFNAEGRRTGASFWVNKEGRWQLELLENWPKGPFARYRMSKLNKYAKKYLEPKILYPVWNVRWH